MCSHRAFCHCTAPAPFLAVRWSAPTLRAQTTPAVPGSCRAPCARAVRHVCGCEQCLIRASASRTSRAPIITLCNFIELPHLRHRYPSSAVVSTLCHIALSYRLACRHVCLLRYFGSPRRLLCAVAVCCLLPASVPTTVLARACSALHACRRHCCRSLCASLIILDACS